MKEPKEQPPPSSPEVEKDILALAFIREEIEARDLIFSQLTPDDFYAQAHKILYGIMFNCYCDSEPIDAGIISASLTKDQKRFLTASFIGKLLEDPGVTDLQASIDHLKDRTARRKAIEQANAIHKAALDPQRPMGDIARLAGEITEAAQTGDRKHQTRFEFIHNADILTNLHPIEWRITDILVENAFYCVFRTKPATDSDRKRPLIPIDSGHRFRRKAATPS